MTSGEQAGCEGKHPYPTRKIALPVVRRSLYAYNVYRCQFCGKFHISGKDKT